MLTLQKGLSTTDRNYPKVKFDAELQDLINQWHQACEGFCPGPSVGPRIAENWNRAVKLPYGKWAHINCVFDQYSGVDRYCKFSLKEDTTKKLDENGLNEYLNNDNE